MTSDKRPEKQRAIRVLGVDKDPAYFSTLGQQWTAAGLSATVTWCATAAEATERCLQAAFDVLLCGPRGVGVNHTPLLEEVRNKYPTTLRLTIATERKADALTGPATLAHQSIDRNLAPAELYKTIEQALQQLSKIREQRVVQTLLRLEKLPSRNAMMTDFLELLSGHTPSVEKICATVVKHPAMVARILKIANSAYFSRAGGVESLDDAVGILGIEMIASLYFAMQLVTMDQPPRNSRLDAEQLWQHSVKVAATARRVGLHLRVPSSVLKEALTAALLHDLGKVVLAHAMPTECAAALTRSEVDRIPLWQAEKPVMGNSHAEVGGSLLRAWGFPSGLVDSVMAHHAPHRLGDGVVKSVVLVHLADAVVHANDQRGVAAFLDTAYLESLGVPPDLARWCVVGALE